MGRVGSLVKKLSLIVQMKILYFFTAGINVQEPVEEVGNEDIEFVILEMKHKRHVLA